jgi:hypothetical protein
VESHGLRIEELTEYPFSDEVRLEVRESDGRDRELRLRIPSWCEGAEVRGPGGSVDRPAPGSWPRLRRAWRSGDAITLRLPAPLRLEQRDRGAVAVQRGPLTFALRVGEEWRKIGREEPFVDWELHPTTAWNYALEPGELREERRPVSSVPWSGDAPPIVLHARGHRAPSWTLLDNSAGPVPRSSVSVDTPSEPIELIPYGSARLRITELPISQPIH